MDKIKELLGEELFTQVAEKLGNTKLMVNDGNMIPKVRFDEVNEAKKLYKEQADKLTTDFTDLQSKMESFKGLEGLDKTKYEEMVSKVSELQTALNSKETEIGNITKSGLLKDALAKAQLKDGYYDLIKGQFNLDELEIKDGVIGGLDDKIKSMQGSYKDMFGTVVVNGGVPEVGNGDDKPNDPFQSEIDKIMFG